MRIRFYTNHLSRSERRCVYWLQLLVVIIYSLSASPTYAQVRQSVIRITMVDTTNYPDVAVHLYGENLLAALETLPLTITEDGAPITITSDTTASGVAGTQTAIVFDAAGNVTRNGPTDEPVYIEVGNALRRLVPLEVLSPERDYLTAISFGPDKQPAVLHNWSQDHQAVVDSIYQYKPVEGIRTTSIASILRFTLDHLADPALPTGQVQSIVLFSDGFDISPDRELFDAVQLAEVRNIRIHMVLIGQERPESRKNLEDLAFQTDGEFVYLASLDALDELWPKIAQGGTRRILTYRSHQEKPDKVTVAVTLPDGKIITVDSPVNAPALEPARITIVEPLAGAEIRREAPAYDTPIQQLSNPQINIQTVIEFPGGYPRAIKSIEYEIPGYRKEIYAGNFDQPHALNISTLKEGQHTIQVRLMDELGKSALSEPLTFTVREVRPPAPTTFRIQDVADITPIAIFINFIGLTVGVLQWYINRNRLPNFVVWMARNAVATGLVLGVLGWAANFRIYDNYFSRITSNDYISFAIFATLLTFVCCVLYSLPTGIVLYQVVTVHQPKPMLHKSTSARQQLTQLVGGLIAILLTGFVLVQLPGFESILLPTTAIVATANPTPVSGTSTSTRSNLTTENTVTPAPLATATVTLIPVTTNGVRQNPLTGNTPSTANNRPITLTVSLITPVDGVVINGSSSFQWQANGALPDGYAFEVIFWSEGDDPLIDGRGWAGSGLETTRMVDLTKVINPGRYYWGVRLVTINPYRIIKMISNERLIIVQTPSGVPTAIQNQTD